MGAAFLVPAALTALSAGGQYINQKNANNKQDTAEIQALGDQQSIRGNANAQVRNLTSQIANDNPQSLADKATGDYISQLRTAAAGSTQGGSTTSGPQTFGGSTSALPGVAGASTRYNAGTASSQKEVQQYGDEFANEMGQIDAATRMRQNEGLAMQTTAGSLNGLAQQSYGQNFVDQLRAQSAGQQNPWLSLASNLVGGAGNALSKNPDAYFGSTPGGPNVAADPSALTGNANTMTNPFDTIGGPVNARGSFRGAPLPLGIAATNWGG